MRTQYNNMPVPEEEEEKKNLVEQGKDAIEKRTNADPVASVTGTETARVGNGATPKITTAQSEDGEWVTSMAGNGTGLPEDAVAPSSKSSVGKHSMADYIEPLNVSADYGEAMEKVQPSNALQQFYAKMHPSPEMTEKQLRRLKRKEKAQKAFAALGDIGSQWANLYYTNKGALDSGAGTEGKTLSGVYAKKWDKWKKDYEDRVKDWRTGYESMAKQDANNNYRQQQLVERTNYHLQQLAIKDRELQQKAMKGLNDENYQSYKAQVMKHLADLRYQLAESQRAMNEKQVEFLQKRIDTWDAYLESIINNRENSASAALMNAQNHSPRTWEHDGVYYDTRDEWEAAIASTAVSLGIPTKEGKGRRQSKKSTAQLKAEIDQKRREQAQQSNS